MQYEILRGDCIEQMRALPDASFDSIVTDPPYELGFMGKSWDASGIAYNVAMWREALRVLKPGGHLLAFSGSRTYHRMACAIEDAGFEVRDQIMWVYGSGFPKSLDVSKAIDKRGGNSHLTGEIGAALKRARTSRGVTIGAADAKYCGGVTLWSWYEGRPAGQQMPTPEVLARVALDWPELAPYAAAIAEAEREVTGQQDGSRLAVAPGQENDRGAVTLDLTAPATDAARQWEGWGTALKPAHEPICVARKPLAKGATVAANVLQHGTGAINIDGCRVGSEIVKSHHTAMLAHGGQNARPWHEGHESTTHENVGRWPANLIHDGSDEVVALFPESNGGHTPAKRGAGGISTSGHVGHDATEAHHGGGSAARFFYCAKASKSDRGPNNTHPTVKPLALMQYLCRLVTPPGGRILDPFAGSGSTIVAALREGFTATGIELLDDHADIIEGRLDEELYGDII